MTPHTQNTPGAPGQSYGYIYLVRNTVNGKVYIGQTIQTAAIRWNQHVCQAKHGKNVPFSNAILKHGRDAFAVCVLTTALDQQSLNLKEKLLIRAYRSMNSLVGYNCRPGGAPGRLTEEHRRKIGAANAVSLLGKKHGPEFIEKRVAAMRGRKQSPETIAKRTAALTGRKMSADAVEKNRQARLGKKLSPEHRANIAAAGKGRVFSAEHKEKLRQAQTGRKYGPLSPETKAKLSLIRTGRVLSEAHKAKISAAHKGKTLKLETRAKISQFLTLNPRARAVGTGKFLKDNSAAI